MLRILALASLSLVVQSSAADPWVNMRFFVGNWEGITAGQPGNGTVTRSYEFVLGGKFSAGEE